MQKLVHRKSKTGKLQENWKVGETRPLLKKTVSHGGGWHQPVEHGDWSGVGHRGSGGSAPQLRPPHAEKAGRKEAADAEVEVHPGRTIGLRTPGAFCASQGRFFRHCRR